MTCGRVEFIKPNIIENAGVDFALELRHTLKGIGKVCAYFIPIAFPALNAPYAVIIFVAKFIHDWYFNARLHEHYETVIARIHTLSSTSSR